MKRRYIYSGCPDSLIRNWKNLSRAKGDSLNENRAIIHIFENIRESYVEEVMTAYPALQVGLQAARITAINIMILSTA